MNENLISPQSENRPQNSLKPARKKGYTRPGTTSHGLHYTIMILSILCIAFIQGIPLIQGLLMSLKDYRPTRGIMNSTWSGLDHYADLFTYDEFYKALGLTLGMNLEYLLLSTVIVFGAALAISGISSARVKEWIVSLLVLPYFIPTAVLAMLAVNVLNSASPSGTSTVLANPDSFRLTVLLLRLVQYGGIPLLVALIAISSRQSVTGRDTAYGPVSYWTSTVAPAARAVAATFVLQLAYLLSSNQELLYVLVGTLVGRAYAGIDFFIFIEGLVAANFSLASTAWIIRFVLQLLLTVAAYFLIRGLLVKDLFPPSEERIGRTFGGSRLAGALVASVGVVCVLSIVYIMYLRPHLSRLPAEVGIAEVLPLSSFVIYLVGAVMVSVLATIVAAVLAYPLTLKHLRGGMFYRLVLIFALCASGGISIHQYLAFRQFGLINTMLPILLTGLHPIIAAFVLKSLFNSRYSSLKEQAELEGRGELETFFTLFIPKTWKAIVALSVLQFASVWNSALPSLVYSVTPGSGSPVGNMFIFYRTLTGSSSSIYLIGGIVALPTLILFLIFHKWLVRSVLSEGLVKG